MEGRICPRGAESRTWRAGDTLQRLARENGITEQAIRLANEGLDFATIRPGDTVCIPPQQLACLSGALYTVARGDTFASIARAYGISTLELSERNPYVDPSALQIGQVLCVPEAAESPCGVGLNAGTVGYGQTVLDILLRYDISYQAFQLANPAVNPNRLLPGQRLCIPASDRRGLCAEGRSYILERGESLSAVAVRFGLTQTRLLQLNPTLAPSDFAPGRVVCVG